jgi:hypothetical protein
VAVELLPHLRAARDHVERHHPQPLDRWALGSGGTGPVGGASFLQEPADRPRRGMMGRGADTGSGPRGDDDHDVARPRPCSN